MSDRTTPTPSGTAAPGDAEPRYRPRWLRAAWFLGNPPELTRRQWRVLGLVATAGFFETYDIYLFTLSLKQIQTGLGIAEDQLGYVASIVRFGALPAFAVTLAADRLGRRSVLLFTILAYTVLTGATAFSPSPETFIALQFFARTFAVAESLLAVVMIAEEFDPDVRGWGIGAFAAIQSCGAGLAAILFALVGHLEDGWRGLYLVGLGPLLLLAYLRRGLPETTRFAGQHDSAGPAVPVWQPVVHLLRMYPGRLLAVAGVLFIVSVAEASANLFGPKYLQDVHGWTPGGVGVLTFGAGAFAILGNTFAGWLSDRVGRKPVTIGFLLGQGVLTIVYYTVPGIVIVPTWVLMTFALLGVNVVLAAYGSEIFPTSYRATAAGARIIVATLGASVGLLLESVLYGVYGSHWPAICTLAAFMLVTPFLVWRVFPETSGRTLEDIAPER